jgi:hypothetical protein
MWEIIIISVIGAGALAYLIYFFISESKKKNVCAGCPYAAGCSKNKKGIKRT